LDNTSKKASTILSEVMFSFNQFDAESDSFHIIDRFQYSQKRDLLIIEHYKNDAKHYGALLLPESYDDEKTYATFVWTNGLNQKKPSVVLTHRDINNVFSEFRDHFVVVPSFRGQALVYKNKRYCSDGFFGDAFDGATNDALRLLDLVRNEFEGVDEGNITVCGVSRGGTVSLLMGIRDTSIARIVSIAGPSDFYSMRVRYRYMGQYNYMFLSKTRNVEDLRMKILRSSPVHFIEHFPNKILLVHGRKDAMVPIENVTSLEEVLAGRDNFNLEIHGRGHEYHDWQRVVAWIRQDLDNTSLLGL